MAGAERDLSTLCRRCGFCCDGRLFESVPLGASEEPPPDRVRLRVVEGRASLLQPCAALEEEGCSVYEHRPRTCRTYVCMLARALEEGEVSLSEALDAVAVAHAHARTAEAALAAHAALPPEHAPVSLWRRVQDAKRQTPEAAWPDDYVNHMKRVFLGRAG